MPRVPTVVRTRAVVPLGEGTIPTPDLGRALGRVLEPAVEFFEKREEERAKSEFNTGVGTFTTGQNDIMLGLPDLEDPTKMGDVYAESVAKLREETLAGIQNATAREEAAVAFDRMIEAGRVKVFGEQNRREADSRIAALGIAVDSGRRTLRTLDPDDPLYGEVQQNSLNAIRLTDDLTLTQRGEVEAVFNAGVESDRAQDEAEALAEATRVAERARAKDASDLFLRIRSAESGFDSLKSEVEKSFEAGGLNVQERTQFQLAIEAQKRATKEIFDSNAFLASMVTDGVLHDPENKDHTNAIDVAYSASALPVIDGLPSDLQAAGKLNFVEMFRRVPEEMAGEIRAKLRGSPQQIVEASDLISRIDGIDGGSVILKDIPNREIEFGIVVSNRLRINPNATEVLQNVKDEMRVTPELEKRRDKDYLDVTKSQENDVFLEAQLGGGGFKEGFKRFVSFGFLGEEIVEIPDPMRAEFDEITHTSYLRHGDIDAARDYALHVVSETWRKSEINRPPRMMKYAPELYYANERFGPNEMREQLADDIAPFVPEDTEPEDLIVNIDTETGRDRTTNGTPQPLYPITRNSEDGIVPVLDDEGSVVLWRPKFETSAQAVELEDEIEARNVQQAETLAAARERREANIVKDPSSTIESFVVVGVGGEPTPGPTLVR